jgi:hypothetical protein
MRVRGIAKLDLMMPSEKEKSESLGWAAQGLGFRMRVPGPKTED